MKEQEKLKATVLKLYSSGSKVTDIVTKTGIPRSTVYYWIKNGLPKKMSSLNLRDYHFLKQKCERQEKIIAILKSAPCTATAPLQERLAAIEQMVSQEYNVNTLCEALDVAKGTYYNHTLRNKRGETKSAQRRRELFPIIEQIYHESNGSPCWARTKATTSLRLRLRSYRPQEGAPVPRALRSPQGVARMFGHSGGKGKTKARGDCLGLCFGSPCWARTSDTLINSQVLVPTELRRNILFPL